jgi:uncharacterized membrane protein YedE/YeeE
MTEILFPPSRNTIAQIVTALLAGVVFGFGLALSGMMDPMRVRGFLDIAGKFDPSLAFVLVGAVAVSGLGYAISRRTRGPLFDTTFHLPARRDIDWKLLGGAAIFGIGWGMAGFCPGPAIASLSLGLTQTFVFTAMMLAGIVLHDSFARATSVRAKVHGRAKEQASARQDADAQV